MRKYRIVYQSGDINEGGAPYVDYLNVESTLHLELFCRTIRKEGYFGASYWIAPAAILCVQVIE